MKKLLLCILFVVLFPIYLHASSLVDVVLLQCSDMHGRVRKGNIFIYNNENGTVELKHRCHFIPDKFIIPVDKKTERKNLIYLLEKSLVEIRKFRRSRETVDARTVGKILLDGKPYLICVNSPWHMSMYNGDDVLTFYNKFQVEKLLKLLKELK